MEDDTTANDFVDDDMKAEDAGSNQPSLPPVSAVSGLPGQLLAREMLSAPAMPGQLASLDHYHILSVVGEGGMGIVLGAVDARSNATVAIKVLKPELAALPQQVHRFLKEARHLQRLKHPHILPVLEVSSDPKRPYFVMPLIEGRSLAQQLSPDQLMSAEDCVAIGKQVAAALVHAHQRGVIHRDLKPGNVLVQPDGTALLADFGLARTVFNDSWIAPSTAGACEGTAHYLSPQLARGEAEDTRCDIYALGALLYEILTGHPPYEGTSVAQILERIKQGPPVALRERRKDLPEALVRVVEGAMAREHRDRYANMADLAADLERLDKRQRPIGPLATWWPGRLRVGRRQALMSGGAMVSVCGLLGFYWFSSEPLKVRREIALPDLPSWNGARLGDWHGDGEMSVVFLKGDALHVMTRNGLPQPSRAFPADRPRATPLVLHQLADVTGDGVAEALVTYADGPNAWLVALNAEAWPVKEYTFAGNVNVHTYFGTNETHLLPLQVADLDGDGAKELLASVTSTWGLRPRGLACFDVTSGRLNWFYETANFVHQVVMQDLDGDGRLELILDSNSPGNGCKLEDGTDDAHAYLYVLSSSGELIRRDPLGGVFTHVRPIATHPESARILVMLAFTDNYGEPTNRLPDVGQILAFDAGGKLTHTWDHGVRLLSACATDLNGDGQLEILVTDHAGGLSQLDMDLREQRRVQIVPNRYGRVDLRLNAVGSLGPRDKPHVVLTAAQLEDRTEQHPGNTKESVNRTFHHDNRVMVLDAKLRRVATHLVAEKWPQPPGLTAHLLPASQRYPSELLVLSDTAQFLTLSRAPRVPFARKTQFAGR